jgi:alkylation response protein AidB-like acyl-CoA dehydrogenase
MTSRDDYLNLPENEDRAMILDMVSQLAAERLAPAAEHIDHAGRLDDELRGELAESGLFGLTASEELGGVGLDFTSFALALEAVAHADRGAALDLLVSGDLVLGALAASETGAEALAAAEGIVGGSHRAAFAHEEASGGVAASLIECQATVDGDVVVLQGAKTNALGAPGAHEILVSAREGEGISLFLVPGDAEGLRVEPVSRLGFRGFPAGHLTLDGLRVASSRRVGAAGAGEAIIAQGLTRARLGITAIAAGLARAARDDAARYADERRQFERRIGDFEAMRERISGIEAAHVTALGLAVNGAAVLDAGRDARHASELAQYVAADLVMKAADHALQVYGGYGYSEEYPAERHYRDARWIAVAFGGRDLLALDIAGRLLP